MVDSETREETVETKGECIKRLRGEIASRQSQVKMLEESMEKALLETQEPAHMSRYYFTFGDAHIPDGVRYYHVIEAATYGGARDIMFARFPVWAFQYTTRESVCIDEFGLIEIDEFGKPL